LGRGTGVDLRFNLSPVIISSYKALIDMSLQVDHDTIDGPRGDPQRKEQPRGRFITFEGGEGTGKSTQAAMLARRIESLGIAVLLTHEPGGSPGAEIIRHVLLSGAAKPLGPEAEAILFAAARQDHVNCAIMPALRSGKWVVCDRFLDSTRVYQGTAGEVDWRIIKALERASIGDLRPDLTFVLDLPVELGLQRREQRWRDAAPDRFEAEALEFHEELRQSYLALGIREPERCVVIDARGGKDDIAKTIWGVVTARFHPATAPLNAEDLLPTP
jgi:dTMP kinase